MNLKVPEVVDRFLDRRVGWSRTVHSDGTRLLSYEVVIGRWVDGTVVMPEVDRWYSITTSRHRGILRERAAARGIPLIETRTAAKEARQ